MINIKTLHAHLFPPYWYHRKKTLDMEHELDRERLSMEANFNITDSMWLEPEVSRSGRNKDMMNELRDGHKASLMVSKMQEHERGSSQHNSTLKFLVMVRWNTLDFK